MGIITGSTAFVGQCFERVIVTLTLRCAANFLEISTAILNDFIRATKGYQ